jgi:thymidylate synthase
MINESVSSAGLLVRSFTIYKFLTLLAAPFTSMDAFQKGVGNLVAIATMSQKIADQLAPNLGKKIEIGSLDGMITDAHIYTENVYDAQELLKKYKKEEENV